MKYKLIRLSLSLGLLISLLFPALSASAAGASISLSANKSTVASGDTVVIAVYMNGGGNAINAVEADLSYPASQLQYVGFSASGSAFEIGASSGGGSGTATLDRGTTGAVTGSGLVGTVTLRALVGSGSAAISVASSSSLVSGGNPVAYGSSGTSVRFGAEAAAATSSGKAAAPAAPAPPKDTTPPVITLVKATGVTPFSATITWTTNEPASSAVEYGLDSTYGLSASSAALTTTHSVALNSAFLNPKTLLHYHVQSADAAGNVATGTDQSLQLPGIEVTIVVRGADGKPQAGATVTVDSAVGTTDSKGTVTLPTSLGTHQVTSTYQGVTSQKPIIVAKSAKPLPPYQLDLAKQPVNPWVLTSIGLFVVVLTLLAIDAVLFGSRFLARLAGLHFPTPHLAMPHLGHTAAKATVAPPAPPATPSSSPSPAAKSTPIEVTEAPTTTDVKPPPVTPPKPPEAEADPEKTVGELMGEPALKIDPPSTKPPIEIKLEPTPAPAPAAAYPAPVVTHHTVSAPVLPEPEPEASTPQDQATAVAKRLKKPTIKAKKPKSITKKPK